MKPTTLSTLQEILLLLRKLVFGIETVSNVSRFSTKVNFDFNSKKTGNIRGVRHFTCRNLGRTIMYISSGSLDEKEPINPDQTFSYNSPYRVCDQEVKITFGEEHPDYINDPTRAKNDGIARYLIDKC